MYVNPGLSKFYYIGPMFRCERPQAGRYREFRQFGIEMFGDSGAYVDVEVIFEIIMEEIMVGLFAEKGTFSKEEVNEFAGPEYFSEKEIRKYNRTGKKIQKVLFRYMAKKNGCKRPLDDRPYQVE